MACSAETILDLTGADAGDLGQSRLGIFIGRPFNWLVKGKITGNSHISWENLWVPVDFPLSQPIEPWKTERRLEYRIIEL